MKSKLAIHAFIFFAFVLLMIGCGNPPNGNQTISSENESSEVTVEPTKHVEKMDEDALVSADVDNSPKVKPVAADITLEDLQSTIRNRHGKPLFLNFWATWCVPCLEEMPHIVKLHEQHKDKIDFMAISADGFMGTEDEVPAKMDQLDMSFTTKILRVDDQNKAIESIDSEWGGELPVTFIYNEQGEKIIRLIGAQSKEQFQQAIQKILQKENNPQESSQ